jgi:hypothetical protein
MVFFNLIRLLITIKHANQTKGFTMRIFSLLLIPLALIGALAFAMSAKKNISGVYIGSASDSAYLVHLIQKDDGSLSGQYREVVLKPSGKLVERNAAVIGVADQGMMTLTVKSGVPLIPDVHLSGSFVGDGGSFQTDFVLNLVRSNDEGFSQQVAKLEASAADIKQRDAMVKAIEYVSDHTTKMRAFNSKVDEQLPKFEPIKTAMRRITSDMRLGLEKELNIIGAAREYRYRDQAATWINQVALQRNSIISNASDAYAKFDQQAQSLKSDLAELTNMCNNEGIRSSDEPSVKQLVAACKPMLAVAKTLEAKERTLRKAYASLGNVLRSETQAQNDIVRKADAAAN